MPWAATAAMSSWRPGPMTFRTSSRGMVRWTTAVGRASVRTIRGVSIMACSLAASADDGWRAVLSSSAREERPVLVPVRVSQVHGHGEDGDADGQSGGVHAGVDDDDADDVGREEDRREPGQEAKHEHQPGDDLGHLDHLHDARGPEYVHRGRHLRRSSLRRFAANQAEDAAEEHDEAEQRSYGDDEVPVT